MRAAGAQSDVRTTARGLRSLVGVPATEAFTGHICSSVRERKLLGTAFACSEVFVRLRGPKKWRCVQTTHCTEVLRQIPLTIAEDSGAAEWARTHVGP